MNKFLRKYKSAFSLLLTMLMLTSWVLSSGVCPSMMQDSISDASTDCCPSDSSNHDNASIISVSDLCSCCGCGIVQNPAESFSDVALFSSVQVLSDVQVIHTYTLDINNSVFIIPRTPKISRFTSSPPIHLMNQVFLN